MTTPAKVEPWMVEAATAIFTDVCAYETGRKDGVSVKEFVAIIAAHAPTIEEFSLETVQEFDELIRQAQQEKQP